VNNHVSPEYASIDMIKAGRWVQQVTPMTGMVK